MTTNTRSDIQAVRDYLNDNLLEREQVVDYVLSAILTQNHVFMLGPPGVAKSMMALLLKECFIDSKATINNMHKTTKPVEIFGPQSLKALKDNDEFKFNTAGYFPEAHFAFFEEIFKGSSAILNSLLTGMQDHIFINGNVIQKMPLVSVFATSNETPGDESLRALYDRFIVRLYIDYIRDDDNFKKLIRNDYRKGVPKPDLTLSVLEAAQKEVQAVKVGPEFLDGLTKIRHLTHHDPEYTKLDVSDRRWRPSVDVAKAYKWLRGGDELDGDDVMLLYNCLWSEVSDRPVVKSLLLTALSVEARTAVSVNERVQEAVRQLKSLKRLEPEQSTEFGLLIKEMRAELGPFHGPKAARQKKQVDAFADMINAKIAQQSGISREAAAGIFNDAGNSGSSDDDMSLSFGD